MHFKFKFYVKLRRALSRCLFLITALVSCESRIALSAFTRVKSKLNERLRGNLRTTFVLEVGIFPLIKAETSLVSEKFYFAGIVQRNFLSSVVELVHAKLHITRMLWVDAAQLDVNVRQEDCMPAL